MVKVLLLSWSINQWNTKTYGTCPNVLAPRAAL
jgi:hypothetical protein